MAQQRLLLLVKSYFARGGTGAEPGMTSPRGLWSLKECGLGRSAAASCRRDARQPRPRAPRRLCSLPGPGYPPLLMGREEGKVDPALLIVLFQKSEFEMREFVKQCVRTVKDERREPLPLDHRRPGVRSPRWRSRSGCR